MDEHNDWAAPAAGGRLPEGEQAVALRQQVAAVLRVLDEAAHDPEGERYGGAARVVERRRPALAAAMLALGETLADFLEGGGPGVDLAGLRAEFLAPLLALSRSLPVFKRAESWVARQDETAELHRLLLEGRPGGFDAPTLLLGDFYQRGAGAAALRTRATVLMRLLAQELQDVAAAGARRPRVLVLGANSILSLGASVNHHGAVGELSFLVVDPDTHALRRARQSLENMFGMRAGLLRASPLALLDHPSRPAEPFDVVYTLTQYDTFSPPAGLAFTRGLAQLLRPGGALLTGGYLPTLPRSTRALATALVGIEWHYWDVAAWRAMLAELPFDPEASQVETHNGATLVVLARRR